jgi:Lrp/AsnC family leucine-responsive transcriptional regulator
MANADLKDRKILYELDLNARQSLTQIGKRVGLKKDVVSYRIKKLRDEGIIRNFWTAINTFKLGYNVIRIYITFQYVSENTKNEIINSLRKYKNTWVVYTTYRSEVDLGAIFWVNNIFEFYQFWDAILDKYEDYFSKSVVSIYSKATCYKKTYLVPEEYDKYERKLYEAKSDENTVEIDETDYHLLNELALDARIPLIDLAEKLDCSSQTVNYRIKNLLKNGVVQAFRVNIDIAKFGLQEYKVDIHLREHSQKDNIIKYLETKPNFFNLNLVLGWADIEPEFYVKDINELNQILIDIDSKFPNTIKKQNYWIIEDSYLERWLPKLF